MEVLCVEFSGVTEVIQLMANMDIMLHATFATCLFYSTVKCSIP